MKQKMNFGQSILKTVAREDSSSAESIIGKITKPEAAEGGFNDQRISYSLLVPSEFNGRFEQKAEKIQELKESIRKYGLYDNLVVKPVDVEVDGKMIRKYRIIAGETRYRAIGQLLGEGDTRYEKIPCNVKDQNIPETKERIILYENNLLNRDYTPEQRRTAIAELQELYKQEAKENGEKINPVQKAAAITNLNERQVQRYNKINKDLIPELKEAFDGEQISVEKAAQLAALDEELQKALAGVILAKGKMSNAEIDLAKKQAEGLQHKLLAAEQEKEKLLKNFSQVTKKLSRLENDLEEATASPGKENEINEAREELEREKAEAQEKMREANKTMNEQEKEIADLKQSLDDMKNSSPNLSEDKRNFLKEQYELSSIMDDIEKKLALFIVKSDGYQKKYNEKIDAGAFMDRIKKNLKKIGS